MASAEEKALVAAADLVTGGSEGGGTPSDLDSEGKRQEAEFVESLEEAERKADAGKNKPAGKSKAKGKATAKTQPAQKAKGPKVLKRPAAKETTKNEEPDSKAAKTEETPQEDTQQPEEKGEEKKASKKLRDQERAKKLVQLEDPASNNSAQVAKSSSSKDTRDSGKSYFFHRHLEKLPEEAGHKELLISISVSCPFRFLFRCSFLFLFLCLFLPCLFLSIQVKLAFQGRTMSRDEKTALVNQAVEKNPASGKYELKLDAPLVKALSSYSTKTTGKETAKGYPRSLMISKLGSEAALERAIAAGEIVTVVEKGLTFYVYQTISVEKSTAAKQVVQARQQREVAQDVANSLTAFVQDFQPFQPLVASQAPAFQMPQPGFLSGMGPAEHGGGARRMFPVSAIFAFSRNNCFLFGFMALLTYFQVSSCA